jgi:hypothetical protein
MGSETGLDLLIPIGTGPKPGPRSRTPAHQMRTRSDSGSHSASDSLTSNAA